MNSAQSARMPTKGFSQVPNSLIENQALLTRPELSLSLIVVRRGGVDDTTVPVSDDNWIAWTGMSPRAKEYAEAGLRKKGTLQVVGRGKAARYSFTRTGWNHFVSHSERTKPHTEGRRIEPACAGRMVHQNCSDSCAMLRAAQNGLKQLFVPPIAQPVAQSTGDDGPSTSSSTVDIQTWPTNRVNPSVSSLVAQPVAQTSDPAEKIWAKALGVLQAIFPLVGVAFLVRLVAVCRAVFAQVTDEQLARAISVAWSHKRAVQKTEGLFLMTVPEALARIVHEKPPSSAGPPGLREGAVRMLIYGAEAMAKLGERFSVHAAACNEFRKSLKPEDDLAVIEETLQRLEGQILQTAADALTAEQRAAVQSEVDSEMGRLGFSAARHSPDQIGDLRASLIRRRTFDILSIPRLSLFYA
jgi:hypothetical protein